MEVCGLELQAYGGASDGTTWACDQQAGHLGPHRRTWGMDCGNCDVPVVCSVSWDEHPDGHALTNQG